ncbi:MAG: hypothetical protein WA869_26570 [Alloacidobacterium sp.]|jgi:hypothetical protein
MFATVLLAILTACQNKAPQTAATGASMPQNLSPGDLASRTVQRRAVEAVIWGMPDYRQALGQLRTLMGEQ